MNRDALDEKRADWHQLAAVGLARAYGGDDPEYGPENVLTEPASTGSSSLVLTRCARS